MAQCKSKALLYLWWGSFESLYLDVAGCLPVEASTEPRHSCSPIAAALPKLWQVEHPGEYPMPDPEAAADSQTQRWENREQVKKVRRQSV